MRYLFLIIILIASFFYLDRTYAHFYNFQKNHFIKNPLYPPKQELNPNDKSENKTLVILGDSLMAGTGSSNNIHSLGYLIGQNLSQGKKLTLVNLASPGVGVEDVLKNQLPKALEEKPDYLVIFIGINDIHNKKSTTFFQDSYEKILSLADNQNTKTTIINIPYLGSNSILLPPWNTILTFRTEQFNKIINKITEEKNFPVIDIYGHFKNDFINSSDLYSEDQFHPSDKGYALWAEFISANINH